MRPAPSRSSGRSSADRSLWLLALALLAAGAGAATWGALDIRLAVASEAWPAAPGLIIESRVTWKTRKGSSMYRPDVRYAYVVDGRTYHGQRVHFGEWSSSDSAYARSVVDRYPKGAAGTVRHEPGRPERSVLEPGARASIWLLPVFGAVFLVAGALVAVVAARVPVPVSPGGRT